MQDFYKNEYIDNLYCRYLKSCSETLDSIDVTGAEIYDYYLYALLSCFKQDFKKGKKDVKKYYRFLEIKRKHDIKLENLNFVFLEKSVLKKKFFLKRLIYFLRRFIYKKIEKHYRKRLQKYFIYIPADLYNCEWASLYSSLSNSIKSIV